MAKFKLVSGAQAAAEDSVYADAGHDHDSTYVALATYNAHTILAATSDNTPAAPGTAPGRTATLRST